MKNIFVVGHGKFYCAVFLPALFSYLLASGIMWLYAGRQGEQEQRLWMREAGYHYAAQVEDILVGANSLAQTLRQVISVPNTGLSQDKIYRQNVAELFGKVLKDSPYVCGIWLLPVTDAQLRGDSGTAPVEGGAFGDDLGLYVFRKGGGETVATGIQGDMFKLQYAFSALRQNTEVLSAQYHNHSNGERVVSLVLPLAAPVRGVLGVDIPVDLFFQIIREFDRHIGYGSVVSDDFFILAHSFKTDLPEQSVRRTHAVREGVEKLRQQKQYEYFGTSIVGEVYSFKVYTRVNLPILDRYWSINLILQKRGLADQVLLRSAAPVLVGGLLFLLPMSLLIVWWLLRQVTGVIDAYRQVLDVLRVPLIVTDRERQILLVNRAALGLSNDEGLMAGKGASLVGRPSHRVLDWPRGGDNACPLERLLRFQSHRTFKTIKNREYEVETGTIRGGHALFAAFYDRVDVRYLEVVIDSCPQGILLIDAANFEVLGLNRAALILYGCEHRERMVGRRLRIEGSTVDAAQCFRRDGLDPIEGVAEQPDSSRHLIKSVRKTTIGGRDFFVVSLFDLSAQKEVEEQLCERNRELESLTISMKQQQQHFLHQEKMASIGQLAAGVAHEINNPVSFVGSNLRTLQEYLLVFNKLFDICDGLLSARNDPKKLEELITQIEEIALAEDVRFILDDARTLARESLDGMNRVRDIVRNLKSFARPDSGEVGEVDVNEQLKLTLKMINNELKYKCSVVEEYADLPLIPGNAGELNQVFMNLIVNAAGAIKERGTVTVHTRLAEDGRVAIDISDTGCGIEAENLNKIFDPFFTTKDIGKGTGLGLYISHGIVERHGGEIQVKSEPGSGTTFTIFLPREKTDG